MEMLTTSAEILGAVVLVSAAVAGILFRRFEIVAGVAIIFAGTLYHASIVDRWGEATLSAEFLKDRLTRVPMDIGDWKGEDQEVTEEVQKTAGAVGHISRLYTNEKTGRQVSVWLAVGHARDICRHAPTTCFPAQGLSQQGDEITFTMPVKSEHEKDFWTARFKAESGVNSNQPRRVFWSWASKDEPDWIAPPNPRITFRNTKAMYKLYFTAPVMAKDEKPEENAGVDLARLLIPVVNQALYSEPVTPVETDDAAEEVDVESTEEAESTSTTTDEPATGETEESSVEETADAA